MMVKNRIRWETLLVLFALSASVWGLWDPNADPSLKFNLNFENNTDYNTIDAVSDQLGIVENCNSVYAPPWEPEPNAKFSISGDFRNPMDASSGDPNACRISLEPNNAIWNFGTSENLRTLAIWCGDHESKGTLIGQRNKYYENPTYEHYWWQASMQSDRIEFQAKNDNNKALHMCTLKTLSELGVSNDEWCHVTILIDRRTRYSSKIYVNGAPVDVEILGHDANVPATVDPTEDSPVFVGAGSSDVFKDYDGLLDEIRLYHRDLNDTEISLLYQWSPSGVGPYALLPLPNHTRISTKTNLKWKPRTGAISQELIFGIDPNLDNPNNRLATFPNLSSTADSNTNADINGPLDFDTEYYWRVDTNDTIVGPVWKFTTEPGYATDPYPEDGEKGIPIAPIDLSWTGSPDALHFDVYLSDNKDWVETNDVNALVDVNIVDSNVVVFDDVNLPARGKKYYWRVISNFDSDKIIGPTWDFRTISNEIVVNTADVNETHNEVEYAALTMNFLDANGNPTLVVVGSLGTDDVAIFNLNDVNISDAYEIVVIPLFDKDKEDDMNAVAARETSRPMAIHVTGDFIFNGVMDISGEQIPDSPGEKYSPTAHCGGYRGPRNAEGETSPNEDDSYDQSSAKLPSAKNRIKAGGMSDKYFFLPNATGLAKFGPGAGGNGPYCVGGGGGHGGMGGDCSRGWLYGCFMGGPAYSDEEVPVPFGGSGGGYGKNNPDSPGGAGGGGVEIAATGNIILGPDAEIIAEGGNSSHNDYPGGGGAGGSVRIIAEVNFVNAGVISVNGGKGGNSTDKPSKCSGGGAGGRVAIFYGGQCTEGSITADGGAPGVSTDTDPGETWGEPGDDGTIYISNSSPKKASAPTPRDDDDIYYVSGGSGTIDLKWYSGYGADVNDQVYFGTTSNPSTLIGEVPATRGQHSVTSPTVSAGNTYYWKVKTDGSVESDTWSFTVVDWYCDKVQKPSWDTTYYPNCDVSFIDFALEFTPYWLDRDNMSLEVGETGGIEQFTSQWLVISGRTP